MGLRAHYQDSGIDFWARMGSRETAEAAVRYWRNMLDAYYELSSGTIVARVIAFSPEKTLELARSALKQAENLVNRMSDRSRADTVGFAEAEVRKAETRLAAVNNRLRDLRDREKILDPRKSAEETQSFTAKLKAEIGGLNADLEVKRRYLDENALQVVQTKNQIAALQHELERAQAQATTDSASAAKPLSGVIGAFDQLENERLFAEKAYQSSLASLETARIDANRQQIYLATIVGPSLPQEPSFPKPLRRSRRCLACCSACGS